MTVQLTVSPDFSPEHIAGWYVFNTWLQRKLGQRIHLELYDDFESQRAAIAQGQVDLIYANPFDAAMLVREKGFIAVAAPIGKQDEAVVAVSEDAPWHHVEEMKPGLRIAVTRDPDVNLIGMILLEPGDLDENNTVTQTFSSYVLVAKALLQGRADCGFFLKQAYDDLSAPIRRQLRPVVTSQISVVRHVLLAGPALQDWVLPLRKILLGMSEPGADGLKVLEALGLPGWEAQEHEDTEFMIDLMDTLMV